MLRYKQQPLKRATPEFRFRELKREGFQRNELYDALITNKIEINQQMKFLWESKTKSDIYSLTEDEAFEAFLENIDEIKTATP